MRGFSRVGPVPGSRVKLMSSTTNWCYMPGPAWTVCGLMSLRAAASKYFAEPALKWPTAP